MKIKNIILIGAVVAFSSCSTAYRTGQTPDDVYYSPAPQQNAYASTLSDKDENSYYYRNDEENDIRRGIQNPIYRSPITLSMSMGYGYSPYSLFPYNNYYNPYYGYNGYGYGFKSMYNPYSYNSFGYNDFSFYNPYSLGLGYSPYGYGYYGYSPFYSPYIFGQTEVNTNRGARMYNLNAYNRGNNQGSSTETRVNPEPIRQTQSGITQPTTTTTGVGRVLRRVFTPSSRNTYVTPNNNRNSSTSNNNNTRTYNNNNNNNNQAPRRSFTPSTQSTQSSSPSSSGNSAPVRTFRR